MAAVAIPISKPSYTATAHYWRTMRSISDAVWDCGLWTSGTAGLRGCGAAARTRLSPGRTAGLMGYSPADQHLRRGPSLLPRYRSIGDLRGGSPWEMGVSDVREKVNV